MHTDACDDRTSLVAERDALRKERDRLLIDSRNYRSRCGLCATANCDMLTDDTCVACERDRLRCELEASIAERNAVIHAITAEREALRREVYLLRAQIEGHCERIAKQSELLSRRAEGKPDHECLCRRCIRENNILDPGTGWRLDRVRMIVCPQCGNKRCPKADDHRFVCTKSNEVGQVGIEEPNA